MFGQENVHQESVEKIDLEWYYNRDSVKYVDVYGLKDAHTCIRGTYRYPGWCRTLKAIATLGLTSLDPAKVGGKSCYEFMSDRMGGDPTEEICKKLSIKEDDPIIKNMDWLGLFSDTEKVPKDTDTYLDALCHLCQAKLKYLPGEQDMIVMKHTFLIESREGVRETRTSTLMDYGQQDKPGGESSMARTVSLPLAAAVQMILEGEIKCSGVKRPLEKGIYQPILKEMEKLGVKFVEKTLKAKQMKLARGVKRKLEETHEAEARKKRSLQAA